MSSTSVAQPSSDPLQQVMQLGGSLLTVAALRAALDANVAEQLTDGAKDVRQLAVSANVNEDALYRCLRLLSSMGIFREESPRTFVNTPASDVLRADHPGNARPMIAWMTNPFHFRAYAEFGHSLRTGETCAEQAFGMPVFDYLPKDATTNREFNDAMTSMSAMVVPAVLATYDFSGLGTLCDVAGGHGMMLTSILQKHKDVRGILFDLPHVVEGAKERIRARGLEERCETVSGDFFQTVPGADSYIMKHIIHDWEESKAVLILKNCVRAMRGNGKVLLIEAVLPGPNVPHLGKLIDIEMLAMPGGRERTEEEYRELLAKAGLRLNRVAPNDSALWVLEAVKA